MCKNYVFSANALAFYPVEMKDAYENAGSWPEDAVEVSDETYDEFLVPPAGKMRSSENGLPCWKDIPQPTHEDQVTEANSEKLSLINQVNDYMNNKQWPGKAAIGRLKEDELAQYNRWLNYLDALQEVDTSTAPYITWPEKPE